MADKHKKEDPVEVCATCERSSTEVELYECDACGSKVCWDDLHYVKLKNDPNKVSTPCRVDPDPVYYQCYECYHYYWDGYEENDRVYSLDIFKPKPKERSQPPQEDPNKSQSPEK